jgi:TRAP-type C4-dicarboxylate transport system substrate-binding protein
MSRLAGVAAAALAVTTLLAATCCEVGSKAGGPGERHVSVLKLVWPFGGVDGSVQVYADAVARLSHGSLQLTIVNNYSPNDVQAEKHLIADVQRGKVQLAWVGSRAWESVGIDSFRPLTAPFLIDSYPLEQKVLASPVTGQMLGSLRTHGLVGLAVLPGPLKKVDGRKPLLRPADFRGIPFAVYPRPTSRATVRVLGARPFPINGPQSLGSLNRVPSKLGLEDHLGGVYGNDEFKKLPYVSMNVNLWPRPLVVFANAKVYRSLSPAQQQALRLAGTDTLAQMMSATRLADTPAGDQNLCEAMRVGYPVHLLTATRGDLAALRRAVQPVYTRLERDPRTRALIAHIETVKGRLHAPADAGPPCPRTTIAAARKASPLDGVYRSHIAFQKGADPGNYGDWVYVFDRGRYAYTQRSDRGCTWAYGRFAVRKKRLAKIWVDAGGFGSSALSKPGENSSPHWSFYRNVLTFDYGSGGAPTERLTRVSTTPSRGALFESKHCRLPAQALQ